MIMHKTFLFHTYSTLPDQIPIIFGQIDKLTNCSVQLNHRWTSIAIFMLHFLIPVLFSYTIPFDKKTNCRET